MLIVHDEHGRPTRISPAVERVLGYTPDEFMGIAMHDMVHPDDLARTVEHLGAIAAGIDGLNFESRCRHKDGSWRWLAWTTPAPGGADQPRQRTYAVARDITLGKLTEQELLYRAQHDGLTGLANRAAFDQALDHALARAARTDQPVGVLLIDLDGFKDINDTHGHAAGDAVLRTVAERLRAVHRKGDVVARLGGDEFASVVEHARREALDTLAARMLAAVCEPMTLDGATVAVGCSIGIATWPLDAQDGAGLLARADRALYQVKHGGKRGYRHAGN
jgi:diguanylate cyclase (GGDEF)-like protein/PAS domain S-box-containing protein